MLRFLHTATLHRRVFLRAVYPAFRYRRTHGKKRGSHQALEFFFLEVERKIWQSWREVMTEHSQSELSSITFHIIPFLSSGVQDDMGEAWVKDIF